MSRAPLPLALASVALVLAALALASVAGCAMSESDFSRLAREVGARNDERYRLAEAAFVSRGFRLVDDERLYVSIDDETRRACRERAFEPDAPDARTTIRVAPATPAGETPVTPTAIEVDLDHVCELFRNQRETVDGTRADGSTLRLVRLDDSHRLARSPDGALVAVVGTERVTSRREVLVERHCDHMPSPVPDAVEHRIHVPVAFADAPLPRVELVYEHEALEVRCTDNTY
jgi:hypothetical protein